jgi:single-strand selective monofunctional uracil DNA glycosylase
MQLNSSKNSDAAKPTVVSRQLIAAAKKLSQQVEQLKFGHPITHVYNPLNYAWPAHERYLQKFGRNQKRVVFLGMNPGPFGMVQTGIPFGEIAAVRDWLKIFTRVKKPATEHPRRPVQGFDCPRSEVSGRRLWSLFAERFGAPEQFFADHFVANYCPLAFLTDSGANFTPDKLPRVEQADLFAVCDEHLRRVLKILEPEWLVGVGAFAKQRGELLAAETRIRLGQILHPSPASPAANRGWAQAAMRQLKEMKIWN